MYSVFIFLDQYAASDIKSQYPHLHFCGLLEQDLLSNLVLGILPGSILLHNMKRFSFIIFTTGLPQGSFFGPFLFSLYAKSMGSMIRCLGFSYHWYTDDTQLYFSDIYLTSLSEYIRLLFLTSLPRWPPYHLSSTLSKLKWCTYQRKTPLCWICQLAPIDTNHSPFSTHGCESCVVLAGF